MKEPLTAKQQERNEKKKKKLAALANLIHLNDQDRIHGSEQAKMKMESQKTSDEGDTDDGFVKITHKRRNKTKLKKPAISGESEDEPNSKRSKKTVTGGNGGGGDNSNITTTLSLTYEQYKNISLELRKRKRDLEDVPSLRLREMGQRASLHIPQEERTPIFLTDIQHLLMTALIGKKSPCMPDRWCFLDKPRRLSHSVVLILEGLSLYHYLSNESKFALTNRIFKTKLEMMLPPTKNGMIIEEIAQIPLTNVQANKLIEEHGSLESALELNKDPTLLVKTIFPIESTVPTQTPLLHPDDKFPRTKLLLSALQMVDEGYPMPLQGELQSRFKSYVFTKEQYAPVTDRSPMYGVDCEMCRTIAGVNELTRISIVNEKLETVYETLVRPVNKITDYLTRYSGITAEIMQTVTKTLKEVQTEVKQLLPTDAILVGQSLNSDLNAMKMMHPYVIDTSVCFNMSGVRRRKSKLQTLAAAFLKEAIQENEGGHDSVEDSKATLKLVKMKLANSIEFGDEILIQRKRWHDIIRMASGDNIKNNLLAHASKRDRCTAIVTVGDLQPQLRNIIKQAKDAAPKESHNSVHIHEMETQKEAVRKVSEIALENELTIANLCVPAHDFKLDIAEKTVEKLDEWIDRLWQSVAHNGLFLVLMGGSAECPTGVAKIAIKHNHAEVAAPLPLTAV